MQVNAICDRRRYKRLPFELHLDIQELFKQDYLVLKDHKAYVSVFDISRGGIGFISETSLPLGFYFQGRIDLGEKEFFYVVMKIVRIMEQDNLKKVYGAEFVGLAPFLANKVDRYEMKLKQIDIEKNEIEY